MADRILTLRDLNRATLARQMLLAREKLSVPAAIERLVGLQAQLSSAPFVGLWTRLNDFRREDLARLIEDRTVVKATLMRGTLHTFTADDYCRFRSTLQPILTQGWSTLTKGRPLNFDLDKLLAAGHRFIDQEPRTFAEITSMVSALVPGHDPGPMRYAIRTHLPLVQVPVTGAWSYPNNPKFALAESWIGRSISPKDNLRQLVYRYLAAFGPASAVDMQTWLGA
ncbi:MAG TPA: winged helix DNA-binding domain-containing protein, partial [Blastocatellia bacterium]|nr:winged helix DNA-binding domain-containing protein [Blastocatellia bacterium]